MKTAQIGGGALAKDAEEAIEAGLAGNRLDAKDFGHGRIGSQPGHLGKLVGSAENPAQ